MEIPVICFTQSGDVANGMLLYTIDGPKIILNDGTVLEKTSIVSFRIQEKGIMENRLPISHNHVIFLTPVTSLILGYDERKNEPDIMYPPSTNNWFSKIVLGGEKTLFIVHELQADKRFLLMIINPRNGELLNAHLIKSYELGILQMERDWIVHNKIVYPDVPESDILRFLDDDPPTWSSLAKLVEGVAIPNLSIRATMHDTMDQLVPQSFPQNIRLQVMAFLAWLNQAKIPEEDPVEFSNKYANVNVFRALVNGHLKCIIDDIAPPQYVKVMFLADKGQLKLMERPTPESDVMNPWLNSWYKFLEHFPVWLDKVLNYTTIMNNRDDIILELPVSKKEAMTSMKYWSDRFALVTHGLFMRAQVNKEAIGLKSMVYVGGAHKWPHKHLEWSARLGYGIEKQHQIQVIIIPQALEERVKRVMPSISSVDWEMTTSNLNKYNRERKKWTVNTSIIEKSFQRRRTVKQLKSEFDKWKGKAHHHLTLEETKILDIASWGIYLASLESGMYSKYYQKNKQEIHDVLTSFKRKGLILPKYFFILDRLNSIYTFVTGQPKLICSIARAYLKHAPSAQVLITAGGASCHIVARIPEDTVYHFLTTLPERARETGLSFEAYPISSYAGYRNNLYSRLHRSIGQWDDDISGLLSQMRLHPKEE